MPLCPHNIRLRTPGRTPRRFRLGIKRDQYLLTRILLCTGLLAAALLLFERIVVAAEGAFSASPEMPLVAFDVWQRGIAVTVAVASLAGVLHFLRVQRREYEVQRGSSGDGLSRLMPLATERPSLRELRDMIAVRGAAAGIIVYVAFVGLQLVHGAPGVDMWTAVAAVPQFVTVSYALVVGVLFAAISIIGVSALVELQRLLQTPMRRTIRRYVYRLEAFPSDDRTYREMFGASLLSRGPPAAAAAATGLAG